MPAFIPTPPGTRYGRLVVLEDRTPGRAMTTVLCRCDCGAELRRGLTDLRQGKILSCGCLRRERARKQATLNRKNRASRCASVWTPYETDEL